MEDKNKKCGKCQEEKEFQEFNKCKSGKYGLHNQCRSCQRETKQKWVENNREHVKEYSQREDVREAARERDNKRYKEDEEYRLKTLERNRLRRQKEPAKIKQRANESKRRKENINYRLRATLNTRLRQILRLQAICKEGSILELIGCSMGDFVKHIESLWTEGMCWENYGRNNDNWQLDHIIPCCSFDLNFPEEIKKCYHFSNVQPLWKLENASKGSRMPDGTDAKQRPSE